MKKWKNEKKLKKLKKPKKWRKKMKKKKKMNKLDSDAKSSTISMILFRNVSLSIGKSTTRFGVVTVFSEKSDNFHWT